MTSPAWDNTQLAAYLRAYDLVPPEERNPGVRLTGVTHGVGVAGEKWWEGYRNLNAAPNSYAALSNGPNTTSKPAADTTAGNVVFDAGFGALQ